MKKAVDRHSEDRRADRLGRVADLYFYANWTLKNNAAELFDAFGRANWWWLS
jgi:hypothetical protein